MTALNRVSSTAPWFGVLSREVRTLLVFLTVAILLSGCDLFSFLQPEESTSVPNVQTGVVAVTSIPQDLLYLPARNEAYISHGATGTVGVGKRVEGRLRTEASIRVGEQPRGLAAGPDGDFVYVANEGGNSISVINTDTRSVETTVEVGEGPTDVAAGPDGSSVYVVNREEGSVSIVSTAGFTEETRIDLEGSPDPRRLVVSPDGQFVYVSAFETGDVRYIDTQSRSERGRIDVSSDPVALELDSEGESLFVASFGSGRVHEVDARSRTVVDSMNVDAANIFDVGADPRGKFMYFADFGEGELIVLDRSSRDDTTFTVSASGRRGTQNARSRALAPYINQDADRTEVMMLNEATGGVSSFAPDNATGLSPWRAFLRQDPVGNKPWALEAVSRGGGGDNLAYVSNWYGNGIMVLNIAERRNVRKVAYVPVPAFPSGMAARPDGQQVYVAHRGADLVTAINTSDHTIENRIELKEGAAPLGVAMVNGDRLYVANNGTDEVAVIDLESNSVTTTIPVGEEPFRMAATPNGNKVYVANQASGDVSVINTQDNTVSTTIDVGADSDDPPEPTDVEVRPNGNEVYVTLRGTHDVVVIDPSSEEVVDNFRVTQNNEPFGVTAHSSGKQLYVSNFAARTVGLYKIGNRERARTIEPSGGGPIDVMVRDDGRLTLVAVHFGGNVSVLAGNFSR